MSNLKKIIVSLSIPLFLYGKAIASGNDENKLRTSLEKEVNKLEPELARLRSLSELRTLRDGLRTEKDELIVNINGETSPKMIKEIEILKSEISKLKPISELATRKRTLSLEKETLMDNIYKDGK